jgi:hypothetical protein
MSLEKLLNVFQDGASFDSKLHLFIKVTEASGILHLKTPILADSQNVKVNEFKFLSRYCNILCQISGVDFAIFYLKFLHGQIPIAQ